jgi:hypothetical protein
MLCTTADPASAGSHWSNPFSGSAKPVRRGNLQHTPPTALRSELASGQQPHKDEGQNQQHPRVETELFHLFSGLLESLLLIQTLPSNNQKMFLKLLLQCKVPHGTHSLTLSSSRKSTMSELKMDGICLMGEKL